LQGVAKALGLPDGASLAALRPSELWKMTQRDLLEVARMLGLTKVSKLNKQALLARVWEGLERLGAIPANGASEVAPAQRPQAAARGRVAKAAAASMPAAASKRAAVAKPAEAVPPVVLKPVPPPPAREPLEAPETPPAAAHKFDVGQEPARDLQAVRARAESTIPWSYGRDRVTAMPVDPERLCVYWEVTDQSIERARGGLGPGGPDAWLSLRIYDVTGRLFDGTNAHSYFDNRIERGDRQWFFTVGKPTSHLIVDVGLKSYEGYFVKIARSGRVEFPRREPVPWSEPEWMTVRVGSGEIGDTSFGSPARSPGVGGSDPGGAFDASGPGWESLGNDLIAGVRRRLRQGRHLIEGGVNEEREVWEESGLTELDPEVSYGWSWEGDREVASWNAGPFNYPVELPALVRESYSGTARTFRTNGRTHVVWGPWQVVIRGVGAHAEQGVIAQWELYRSWTTSGWREVSRQVGDGPGGSSERMVGASERWGRSGSEVRLMGASERFAVGASEIRMMGASERWFLGASEWLMRGASERRWQGSSEWRFLGASEKLLAGASESRFIGASEQRLGGASEQLPSGSQEPDYRFGTTWPDLGTGKPT
jgi:hypothetical protein